jgi:stress response protein YsnF
MFSSSRPLGLARVRTRHRRMVGPRETNQMMLTDRRASQQADRRLPANARVPSRDLHRIDLQPEQIDHDLIRPRPPQRFREFR